LGGGQKGQELGGGEGRAKGGRAKGGRKEGEGREKGREKTLRTQVVTEEEGEERGAARCPKRGLGTCGNISASPLHLVQGVGCGVEG
jgi:hypothetical protein